MQAIRTHVAGVDVHKDILVVTVLRGKTDERPEVLQFEANTFTEDLMACGLKLLELGVKDVAIESTGIYWVRFEAERRSCSQRTTFAVR